MCATCMPCQRVPKSVVLCARHGTYTSVVEFIGFDHDSVVLVGTWRWRAEVNVLSIHK